MKIHLGAMIGFDINEFLRKELEKHGIFSNEILIKYCQGHDVKTFVPVEDDQILYDAANARNNNHFTFFITEGEIKIGTSRVHFTYASIFFYFDESGINIGDTISFDCVSSQARSNFHERITEILDVLYRKLVS